jgi:hypothetical protein
MDGRSRSFIAAWFGACALFALILIVVGAVRGRPQALLLLLMPVLILAIGWRWTRVAVIGDDTELVIRNLLRTERILRGEIQTFRVGGSKAEYPGRAIRAVLKDGSTVVLSATGRYSGPSDAHEGQLAKLNRWRRAAAHSPGPE